MIKRGLKNSLLKTKGRVLTSKNNLKAVNEFGKKKLHLDVSQGPKHASDKELLSEFYQRNISLHQWKAISWRKFLHSVK